MMLLLAVVAASCYTRFVTAQSKPPVFLLDTMSFIFRAYHAMQRSRPMSTRAGLPTAAIYVFVNMIKKLRQDFQPLYFAAVFDVSGEVFRDERARAMKPLRKWNGKTQSFDEVSYEGYKANRAAMPEDLRRQIPYIRRALEALRIPILEAEGFEADDVIGTLAREAAEEQHEVFIVSGDKDMMQLVTPTVKILNPQKDNLILDPAKVVEVLGVPPEKVVDVMALRGDAVDNIPGAPGIGDKGSVELIVEFGSVEAVLDRASEVKRKSYRESLEQNRDAVLLSKELVTIDSPCPARARSGRDADAAARPRSLPRTLHRAGIHLDAARLGACGRQPFRSISSKIQQKPRPPPSTPPRARRALPLRSMRSRPRRRSGRRSASRTSRCSM